MFATYGLKALRNTLYIRYYSMADKNQLKTLMSSDIYELCEARIKTVKELGHLKVINQHFEKVWQKYQSNKNGQPKHHSQNGHSNQYHKGLSDTAQKSGL